MKIRFAWGSSAECSAEWQAPLQLRRHLSATAACPPAALSQPPTLTVGGGSSAAKQVVELGIRFQGDAGLVGPVNDRLQAAWLEGCVGPGKANASQALQTLDSSCGGSCIQTASACPSGPHLLKLAVGPTPCGQLCLRTPQAQAIHAAAKGSPARKLPGACLQAVVRDA